MSSEYKQCPNGHYYQGDHCPYCKQSNNAGDAGSMKTEVYGFQGYEPNQPTKTVVAEGDSRETMTGNAPGIMGGNYAGPVGGNYGGPMGGNYGGSAGGKTTVIDGGPIARGPQPSPNNGGGIPMSGRTVFGDDDGIEDGATQFGPGMQRQYREARKLVGWLVSYTLDQLGVDFKLYEGRNIIGRDQDCSITLGDNRVSAKHAVLLFRAGKYSITDSQSSHGTFVNNRDIELEPCYLSDGDVIQVGQTILKFRSSL